MIHTLSKIFSHKNSTGIQQFYHVAGYYINLKTKYLFDTKSAHAEKEIMDTLIQNSTKENKVPRNKTNKD